MPDTALAPPDPGVAVKWSEDVGQRIVDLYASGLEWDAIAALPGMPSVSTISDWKTRHESFRNAFACARTIRADAKVAEARALLMKCDPNALPLQASSSRVSLANYQASHLRWEAAALDRDTYGDRPPQVNVQVNNVTTGFLDAGKRSANVVELASGDAIAHVEAPDVSEE